MTSLRAIFWKGLATVVPLTVTVYALYWAVVNVERLLANIVPDGWYFPGSGLLLAVTFVLAFGALMHFLLFEWLVSLGSELLNRIPIVKSVYSALQDFFSYLGHRTTEDMSRVVLVTFENDRRLVGFVTNPSVALPGNDAGDLVSVYLPMSYQIGGFMVMLPSSCLTPLDMSAEDAMRMVLTAGVRSS